MKGDLVLPQPRKPDASGPRAEFAEPPCGLAVITTSDGPAGSGSLRSAIICANSLPGHDTITLQAGTYVLSIAGTGEDLSATGDLDITDDLTLDGAGAATTIIDGAQIDRVFDVIGAVTATFSRITVTHGQAVDCRPAPGLPSCGGAILNNSLDTDLAGTVNVTNSVISNSSTTGVGADGGAIFVSGSQRTTNVVDTTISGNTTYYGGAVAGIGHLSVVGSTITGNSAGYYGGGIYNQGTAVVLNSTFNGNSAGNSGGAILSFTDLTVTNSTITGNLGGGALHRESGTIGVYNTIVANQASGSDCSGTMTSHGYNLESTVSCGFTATGDLQNANPLLGPLQNNGGLTHTHKLMAGSPAINRIPSGVNGCGTTITTDQRGISRPQGTGCDSGSYEAVPEECVPPPAGLVSWWPGDGNGADIKGTNDVELFSGATFTSDGRVSGAFSFENPPNATSGQYAGIAPPSGIPLGNSPRTVDLWFKTNTDLTAHTEAAMFEYGAQSEGHTFGLITSGNAPGKLYFYGNSWDLAGTTTIQPGIWYHAAVTYDGTTVALYLNGNLEASGARPLNTVLDEYGLTIGLRPGAAVWNGQIDEVGIFDRVLSEAEIRAIHDAGGMGACHTCSRPPNAMISWWPAEGNANDFKGGNNGSLYGTTSFVPGKVGQAFNFDGEGSVVIPDVNSLDLTTSFTLEAWVNPAIQLDYQGAVISKVGGINGNNGYQFGLTPQLNKIFCQFNAEGEPWAQNRVVSEAFAPTGKWSHIACTYDHLVLAVYLNGLRVTSTVIGPKSVVNSSSNLRISGDDNFNVFFKGMIDEPAVYGRALSTAEIEDIHNAGNAGKCTRASRTAFDFDADGKADLSVFRPSVGEWYYERSSNGVTNGFGFGSGTDKVVPADYTGDGKTDIAFFRPSDSNWFILRSEDSTYYAFPFGTSGDTPVAADYDGDGQADAAVFRPSIGMWFILRSTGGVSSVLFGDPTDIPVPADYDGDGKADVGIYRPSLGQWWNLGSGSSIFAATFGSSTDKPVPGDYTGDGKADAAFYRPSEGVWYVLRSEDFTYYAFPFGNSTDKPAPADFDGDGKFDAAVFRPSDTNWYISRSTGGVQIQQFGLTNDIPLPGAFVP